MLTFYCEINIKIFQTFFQLSFFSTFFQLFFKLIFSNLFFCSLCSVTVLGPGDAPPSHSSEEFLEPEVLRSPSGLGNTRRGYNMIVKAYRGEEIASDDGSEGVFVCWLVVCCLFVCCCLLLFVCCCCCCF